MRTGLRRVALFGLLILSAGLLSGCGAPADPEAQLRQVIAEAEAAIEARALTDVSALISPQYQDAKGLDKRGVTRLLLGYLHRHRNIHLLSRVQSVALTESPAQANVVLLVAMTGVPVATFDALTTLRADLHRFDLVFVGVDNDWQLIDATWRRASLDELLP